MKDYGDFYSSELKIVNPLLECLYNVLDDAAAGTKITKAYVKSAYQSDIDSFNKGI